jgi:hypothetical protein
MNHLCVAAAYGPVQRPHTIDVHMLNHCSSVHEQLKPDQNSLKSPAYLYPRIKQPVLSQTASDNFPVSSDEFQDTYVTSFWFLLFCLFLSKYELYD